MPSLLNRLAGGRSFYEELRARESPDEEERIGMDIDEENMRHNFNELDLENAGLVSSVATVRSPLDVHSAANWHEDEADNEVPASLLYEVHGRPPPIGGVHPSTMQQRQPIHHSIPQQPLPQSLPQQQQQRRQEVSPSKSPLMWETAHSKQFDREDPPLLGFGARVAANLQVPQLVGHGARFGTVKERTMWKWANVTNMDAFFNDVYDYYLQSGLWCIVTARMLEVVQRIFTAALMTFLTQCVDYGELRRSSRLEQIVIPHCTRKMSTWWNVVLWVGCFYVVYKMICYALDMRRLLWMRDFYTHLLEIPDSDMQTVSWQDIVAHFMLLRDGNPHVATNLTIEQRRFLGCITKQRVDAHDIANRLMRRDNYIIAMINKDILDLSLPAPFLRNYQFCSASLESWLSTSIIEYVFQGGNEVSPAFLKPERRGELSQKLRERFYFYGFMSLLLAPFYFFYQFVLHMFMNFNEYRSDASVIMGRRVYTPYARWRFREFNELPHIFQARINDSYPAARAYVDQFPKVKTEHLARTVVFMSGALIAVLAVATMLDPEVFLTFEITPDRTVLFYLTILGSVFAAARGMLSDHTQSFNPAHAMRTVIHFTHYEPDHWKGRLHSYDVKKEFSQLYKPQFFIFLEELLGILVTPFVLWFSLPKCSEQIVDFFREFTVHVNGVGYVCAFAQFDFKREPSQQQLVHPPTSLQDGVTGISPTNPQYYHATKYNKMAASYYNFLDNYVVNPKSGASDYAGGAVDVADHGRQYAGSSVLDPPLGASVMSIRPPPGSMRKNSRFGSLGHSGTGGGSPSGAAVAPSPMASMLLDPHHQPMPGVAFLRPGFRNSMARSGFFGDVDTIEETEDGPSGKDSAATSATGATTVVTGLASLRQSTRASSANRFRRARGLQPKQLPARHLSSTPVFPQRRDADTSMLPTATGVSSNSASGMMASSNEHPKTLFKGIPSAEHSEVQQHQQQRDILGAESMWYSTHDHRGTGTNTTSANSRDTDYDEGGQGDGDGEDTSGSVLNLLNQLAEQQQSPQQSPTLQAQRSEETRKGV